MRRRPHPLPRANQSKVNRYSISSTCCLISTIVVCMPIRIPINIAFSINCNTNLLTYHHPQSSCASLLPVF